jgi:hypothetical protein
MEADVRILKPTQGQLNVELGNVMLNENAYEQEFSGSISWNHIPHQLSIGIPYQFCDLGDSRSVW